MPSPNHKSRSSDASLSRLSTGAALRRGELKISDPVPFSAESSIHAQPNSANMDTSLKGLWSQDATWPRTSSPPSFHPGTTSTGFTDAKDLGRASIGPSIVPSSMSTAPSKASLLQKKNTGFRATIKRIFGSKRQSSSFGEVRRDYHRSDPGNLTSIVEKQTNHQVARRPSQPIGNVTRTSALGSHSPHGIIAGVADNGDLNLPRRRRRNTLPSLVLTGQEAQFLAGKAVEPFANQFQTARMEGETNVKTLKRQSRSADALNDLIASIQASAIAPRDRKDEIAYWRRSVLENPLPGYSTQTRPEAAHQRAAAAAEPPHGLPVQPFDFGLGSGGRESANLEQRVNTLEIKLFDFEYALAKLQGNDIPKPILNSKPMKRRSVHDLFPDNSTKCSLTSSPSQPVAFSSSPEQSPIPSTEEDELFRPNRASRATTIRPSTARRISSQRSNAPSPSSIRLTSEQFDTLMDLIKHEANAREQMQLQIHNLQKEVDVLKAPVYATIRTANYPTPSPESLYETSPVAPRAKPLHRSPPFQIERALAHHETSRFSMTDAESDADDGFQDVFETPQENKFMFETMRGSPLVGMI